MTVTAGEGGLQVVWFKRDLRVRDHAPLWHAAQRGPVLGLYVYEPELLAAERAAVHATMGSADAREGMMAFLEKRPPIFNQPDPR